MKGVRDGNPWIGRAGNENGNGKGKAVLDGGTFAWGRLSQRLDIPFLI